MPRKRFYGSFAEDAVKRSSREKKRKSVIAEKNIRPDVVVRVKGRNRTWVVQDVTKDHFVRLQGGSYRVSPDELEVVAQK